MKGPQEVKVETGWRGAPLEFLIPGGEFAFPEFLVTAGDGLGVFLTTTTGNKNAKHQKANI